MQRVRTILGAALAASALAAALAGCGSDETSTADAPAAGETGSPEATDADTTVDKAGNAAAPVTLTLAVSGRAGRPTYQGAELFAEAVSELSGGEVTVQLFDIEALDLPGVNFEWEVIDLLQAGEYDMVLVPARAWGNEGVRSLDPLQLPLIVADEQTDRVAQDPVATDLMAGLADIDVTGLALLPEGLRHMVILDGRPVETADDLAGLTVRAALSPGTYALIDALGSQGLDPAGQEGPMVDAGELHAGETSLSLINTLPTVNGPAIGVANLTLYAEFGVLAMRSDTLGGLDDEVQDVLRRAASQALEDKIATRPREADLLVSRCEEGFGITSLPDAELAEALEQLDQVVTEASTDPDTASLIEAVRNAAGPATAAAVTDCEPQVDEEVDPATSPAGDVDAASGFPSGTFRSTGYSTAELTEIGLSGENALSWAADVWEIIFHDGLATERMIRDGKVVAECVYEYRVDGDHYTVSGHDGDCGWIGDIVTAKWTFDGERFTEEVLERHQRDAWAWDEISGDILKVD